MKLKEIAEGDLICTLGRLKAFPSISQELGDYANAQYIRDRVQSGLNGWGQNPIIELGKPSWCISRYLAKKALTETR